MRKLTFFGAAVFVLAFSGCAALRPNSFVGGNSRTQTIVLLDQAAGSLNESSQQPHAILERTLKRLPPDNNGAVRRDIGEFLLRFPATNDLVCGRDFLRSRVLQELGKIKDSLLNFPDQALDPEACYSTPFLIDLTQDPEPQGTLDLFGYDFDRVPLELVLVHDGSFVDVTFALTMKSHSHLTVKLGDQGVRFSRDSEALGLVWGHIIRYSIPIVQPSTVLCASRTEEVPADRTIRYSPPRIASASGARNSTASFQASLTLESDANALNAALCATVISEKGSVFSGCGNEQIFTTGTDQLIEEIIGYTHSGISFLDIPQPSSRIRKGNSGGPVARWTFDESSDATAGSAGPQMAAQLNRIRIVSTPASGCISPIAYLEGKRMNLLSRETIRRLDAQLGTIDPAILKFRPRFAPPADGIR